MRVLFDITDKFSEILTGIFFPRGIKQDLREIKEQLNTVMSALENLQSAVTDNATATTEGFAAVGEALGELATDIENLDVAPEVQAEVDRLVSNTTAIRTAMATIATNVRDAIPTAPAEEPEV
jgi:methyl-accepting chemotaxis protein